MRKTTPREWVYGLALSVAGSTIFWLFWAYVSGWGLAWPVTLYNAKTADWLLPGCVIRFAVLIIWAFVALWCLVMGAILGEE